MMGVGHGFSGGCAGLAVGNALMLPPPLSFLLGFAGAGAAVLSDIDCKGSTAATAFGPVSQLAHYGCVELHYMVAAALDPNREEHHSAHRGITHWWPWWIATGGAVALGCMVSKWVTLTILVALFTLAIRAMTIPEPRPKQGSSLRYQVAHAGAYAVLNYTPLVVFRSARKHVNKTKRVGMGWLSYNVPVGKILVFLSMVALVFGADHFGRLPDIGPWLGLLVFAGQFLHWLGDCPTEMGVPGVFLTRLWRLPKWIAFKAGGPFEVAALWIPMGFLLVYLMLGTLGLRSHEEVMNVLRWIGAGFGVLAIIIAILTVITKTVARSRYA